MRAGWIRPSVTSWWRDKRAISATNGSNAERTIASGVVNNDFYSGSSFECADITTLATDDAAFDLIGFNMEYCYRVFNGGFSSYTLNALNNYFFASLLAVILASSIISLM